MASLVLDRLNVVTSESSPSDVTAVLLHGWTMDLTTWDRVAAALPGRVVRYDVRGHGLSTGSALTLSELADDLAAVLDEYVPTGRIVLAGHSLGGMTIMALAEQRPELFSRVTGVALVATSCGDLPRLSGVERLAGRWLVRRPKVGFGRLITPGLRVTFGRGARWADVRAAAAMAGATTGEAFVGLREELTRHQRREALSVLSSIPTVVMAGSWDVLTPMRHSRAIADALPSAEFVIYPKAGHMLPFERSEDVARRIAALM
ncbi:pimeloyl-ACP methyl ester carboxylesterase [Lentzea atacamensis]|uniref:Pimeloyl-ACP methyl ester carboxylesterase n=2 Tax=Lentzea TaxID=165301 RepID=A0A316IE83_9PSEU|nr:alpha/beta hydrolase [Lentzea atacamensis]PWK91732.1 pimeloyl-ACP methyl ester carboxylesterase [Lentzea atacamensis]RAS63706.1 pimeloyl-ACP methyl ester carboxylesterase [Lentzea atacamensis]